MANLYVLLAGVTCVLAAAWFVTDLLCRSRPELQDLVWRAALALVAGLPIAWLARTAMPQFVVETPVVLNFRTEPIAVVRSEGQTQGTELDPKTISVAGGVATQTAAQFVSGKPLPSSQSTPKSLNNPTNAQIVDAASTETPQPTGARRVETDFSALFQLTVLIWLVGTVWSLTNLIRGAFRLRSLVRDSEAADEIWQGRLHRATALIGLHRAVQMRTSAQIASPLVVGLLNPVLLWPSNDIVVFDEQSCDEILLHELAHVRRGDLWTNMLLQFTTALWWPHPLVHLMRARAVWLREILCDAAVSQHGDRTHYAETLLQIAIQSAAMPPSSGQLAIEPRGGTLEARVTSVLQGTATRWSVSKWFTRITWVFTAGVFVAVAAVHVLPIQATAQIATTSDEEAVESKLETKPAQTVQGRVMSPSGKNLATEGTVYLLKNPKGDSITLPTRPVKTLVNGKGEFMFKNVEPGSYRIWVETKSLTSLQKKLQGQHVNVYADRAPSPVSLDLHDGCNYEVTVRSDATGSPIANAEITFGWTDIVRSYRTDANGIARIGGLAINDWYFVIRADQHATRFKKISAQPLGSTTPLTFNLHPEGKVYGVVTTPDGAPVANVSISASIVGPAMTPNLNRTRTDAAGIYELTNLPLNQRVRLSCSPDTFQGHSKEVAVPEDTRTLQHDFTLTKQKHAGDALFTVVGEEGEVISNATLINEGNSSGDIREGKTNEIGECRLRKLYENFIWGVTVIVKAEGYIPERVTVEPGSPESLAVQTIQLRRGKRLFGRLLKPDRSPAAGVRIYYNRREYGELEGGRVETDKNGLFEITGLPEKSVFTVYTPKGFAPIQGISLPVGQTAPINIVMQPEAVLVVRAVDAKSGDPIPEYNVRVAFSRDQRPGDPSGSKMAASLSNPGQNIVGSEKQFRHGGFEPGLPLQVTVSAEGYEPKVFPRVEAAPAADGELLVAKLIRTDPSSLMKVAGRLLNKSGIPVEGAHMRLVVGAEDPFQPNGQWRFYRWDNLKRGDVAKAPQCLQFLSTTTDSAGLFKFDGVKDAPWLELFHTGGGMAPTRHPHLRKVSDDLSKLELQTMAAGSVKVEVDAKAWPKAEEVQIYSAATYSRSGRNLVAYGSSSGQLRLDDRSVDFTELPSGDYRATITAKRVYNDNGSFNRPRLHSKPFQVESGKTTTVRFN